MDEDDFVVLLDVISLFTSIPIDMDLDIVKRILRRSNDWKNYTQLTKDEILDLLSFLLHSSYFIFEGTQYHQVSECSMGSSVSEIIAELVLQEVEGESLETRPAR